MQFKKLGRTDIDVSILCLGTMTWGEQNTEAEGHEQMDYAVEKGINFFDTAELYSIPPKENTYGRTEEIIGTWFKERKNREDIILASKVAGPGLPWIRGENNKLDKDNIFAAIEESLKRLQTDYIDLYQLHWPNRLETLDELIKQGKIRHAGLSNETSWGTMKYLKLSEEKNLPRMVSIQNEYSLTCRIFEPDLAEIAIHEDIGLLAYSPLTAGAISGKYLDGRMPEGSRRSLDNRPSQRATEIADNAIREYIAVAKRNNLDVCQMAIAFVNSRAFFNVINEINDVYKKYPRPY
jgi:aryl-alcohol dehydrogenase-like predicted oxidoreductase